MPTATTTDAALARGPVARPFQEHGQSPSVMGSIRHVISAGDRWSAATC